MTVFRVNKTSDYTIMSNYHFKEKKMTNKAKGLLSVMLSLPDDWNYTEKGLTELSKDSIDGIRSALKELEEFGYLERKQIRNEKGIFGICEYNIYEKPITDYPILEKPITEKPTQLNTNISNTKKINNLNNKRWEKPSIEDITKYCDERNNGINAEAFYDFYESKNWYVGKNKMRDWKAAIRTWEQRVKPVTTSKKWWEDE